MKQAAGKQERMTKWLRILFFLIIAAPSLSAQVAALTDKDRERISKELAGSSSLIVVAIPEPTSQDVVSRPKWEAALASNSVHIPPDYVNGSIFSLRVLRILAGKEFLAQGETVDLFVGGSGMDILDALNVVVPGKKAIFFLSRMSESDPRLRDAGVFLPESKTKELSPLDLSRLYRFTQEDSFSMMSSSSKSLAVVKKVLRATKHSAPPR
jgi:hypothetical protein